METTDMKTTFDGSQRTTRRRVLAGIGSMGIVGVGGSMLATPAIGKELTIRFNHTDGRGGEAFHFAEKFKELAEKATNGRIKVQTFHSAELGAEKDIFDSLQVGSIEMARTGSLIISAVAPEYSALEMPYVFRSQQHLRNVLAGPIGQAMHNDVLTRKGIRVLALVNRTPRQLTTKNREVRVPADLRGLKLRVPEIPVYVEAWRALGASPTPMAFPEVFTGLQQGAIDGQENPVGTIFGNSFFDVQKFLIKTAHVRGNGWFFASERFWQSLSTEDRQILQRLATEAATYADQQVASSEKEIEQQLQKRGMTILEPDPTPFRDIVWKELPPKFQSRWKPGLLDQIQQTKG